MSFISLTFANIQYTLYIDQSAAEKMHIPSPYTLNKDANIHKLQSSGILIELTNRLYRLWVESYLFRIFTLAFLCLHQVRISQCQSPPGGATHRRIATVKSSYLNPSVYLEKQPSKSHYPIALRTNRWTYKVSYIKSFR